MYPARMKQKFKIILSMLLFRIGTRDGEIVETASATITVHAIWEHEYNFSHIPHAPKLKGPFKTIPICIVIDLHIFLRPSN